MYPTVKLNSLQNEVKEPINKQYLELFFSSFLLNISQFQYQIIFICVLIIKITSVYKAASHCLQYYSSPLTIGLTICIIF